MLVKKARRIKQLLHANNRATLPTRAVTAVSATTSSASSVEDSNFGTGSVLTNIAYTSSEAGGENHSTAVGINSYSSALSLTEVTAEPKFKIPRLFANYVPVTPSNSQTSVKIQLGNYLHLSASHICDSSFSCLEFWNEKRTELSELYPLAMRVLSVPAFSAPVERVFSQGELIMKLNRAGILDNVLSNLIFLMCNIYKVRLKED